MTAIATIGVLLLSGVCAGFCNALAGGGPVITLAGMTALGLDPRIASMTSTVALSPGQIVAGLPRWQRLRDLPASKALPWLALAIATGAGAGGALLLLSTSAALFRSVVPWLILFATIIYAGFSPARSSTALSHRARSGIQSGMGRADDFRSITPLAALALLGVYGGYFGGGNSFLLLALLVMTTPHAKIAAYRKNTLVAAMNGGACLVFIASGQVAWSMVIPLAGGGVVGSWAGGKFLQRLPPAVIRVFVVGLGLMLAFWLFADGRVPLPQG